jgi:hypothetical protein
MGGHLAEHAWMDRVLEQTWANVERLKDWGYPFPTPPPRSAMPRPRP